ncbi:hypothetical protein CPB86DRAFT_828738 [Serendipita vermifera]|nr:hypothetical protein CPB86DRAFT_828738 [Serendipita vermifera]
MQNHSSESARLNAIFVEARQKFQKYGRGPRPVNLFDRFQWVMSNVHLLLVDSIQNIYNQADDIPEHQEEAFSLYCYICQQSLHHHHWFEENHAFPMLEPEFKCDVLEEHALFSAAVDRWEEYLEDILGLEKKVVHKGLPPRGKPRATYDPKKMKKCIEDLSGPLFVHLQHEIDWISPDKLRGCGLPLSKLEAAENAANQYFSKEVDSHMLGYWTVRHARPEAYFPGMPWFVKKILMPWVFYWKYRSAWHFAPNFSETDKWY